MAYWLVVGFRCGLVMDDQTLSKGIEINPFLRVCTEPQLLGYDLS